MLPSKLLFICFIASLISCTNIQSHTLVAEAFVVVSDHSDPTNEKWTDYLYTHLKKRSITGPTISKRTVTDANKSDAFLLQIDIQTSLSSSYKLVRRNNQITLISRSEKTALWLIYELIAKIGEDNIGIEIDDLPPSTIDFKSSEKTFDFDYREPFLSPNTHLDYARILGNNSIDADWGIWGHQLAHIIDMRTPEVWAEIDGEKTNQQICFSADATYLQVKAYIVNQYGTSPTVRFMLAPNDNDLVCTCQQCQRLQNTKTNASPAVSKLNNRLAKDFPTAQFFLLAYRTTKFCSPVRLEKNVGVFLTSIDLPKGQPFQEDQKAFQSFKRQVEDWKTHTSEIYLWDYAANFDDYLTPIPVLLGFQQQGRLLKSIGIKGLFIHASGYDYAPFEDVKTYVLSALMKDLDSDVETLIQRYFKKKYPNSFELLSNYYLNLESEFQKAQLPYDMYSGFETTKQRYFNTDQFASFYLSLERILPTVKNSEKVNLEKLFAALSFTQLQLAYSLGIAPDGAFYKTDNQLLINPKTKQHLIEVTALFSQYGITHYSERNTLSTYLKQWQQWVDTPIKTNLLTTHDLDLSNDDDNNLTDGKLGFYNDYLLGWTVKNSDLKRTIKRVSSAVTTVRLRFLSDPIHRIYPPYKVIMHNQDNIALVPTINRTTDNTTVEYQFHLPKLYKKSGLQLNIINSTNPRSQWACDEIQFLKN